MPVTKKKIGRPESVIDKELFEECCFLHCTELEICSLLKVTDKTLAKWCQKEYDLTFSEAFKKFSSGGKKSLRRAQWNSALSGNPTMMVWLGKQELGQRDKSEQTVDVTERNKVDPSEIDSKIHELLKQYKPVSKKDA